MDESSQQLAGEFEELLAKANFLDRDGYPELARVLYAQAETTWRRLAEKQRHVDADARL